MATPHDDDGGDFKSSERARDAYQKNDASASMLEHKKKTAERATEHHGGAGSEYVKAIVFGGLDGIMTILAIVISSTSSESNVETWKLVLIVGFASLIANGFSMGFSEYIGGHAERDHAIEERKREMWETMNYIEGERKEMVEIYKERGLSDEDATRFVEIISKDPEVFVSFMMVDELGILDIPDEAEPRKHGLVMFLSFVFFGAFPLLIYTGGKGQGADGYFWGSVGLAGATLIALGFIKGHLSKMNLIKSGVTMLINGGLVGGISFGVGTLVNHFVEN